MNREDVVLTRCVAQATPDWKEELAQAARLLREGALVAFPTETVYGLGANALSEAAVAAIFAAKGRPSDNPLIVHIADRDGLSGLVREIPEVAEKLMNTFWPGALTLVCHRHPDVPDVVTAGLDTVAVRMPVHPVALALIRAAGVPVAAPSANRSGRPSPTTAAHVLEDMEGRIPMILDGGACEVGVESTVLDVTVSPAHNPHNRTLTPETCHKIRSATKFDPSGTISQLGERFRQGGMAGYGLRRQLVDSSGASKAVLALGEQKSIQTDRVVLIPGPPEEREVVQRIYRSFLDRKLNESEIATELNRGGVPNGRGGQWTRGLVREVLANEKYIGNNVFNRVSFKLKRARVRNPPDMWVRCDAAFEPIVDARDFFTVQGILLARHRRLSDDELLEKLRSLHEREGRLSGLLIDESEGMPSPAVYRHRFGSLVRAYQLIGYTPARDYAFLETNRNLRAMFPTLVEETIGMLRGLGATVERDQDTDLLTINGEFSASLVISRCRRTESGDHRWLVRLDESLRPDITVVVRMDPTNETALDYYLLPALDLHELNLRFREDNGIFLDAYRFETLDYFIGMGERVEVAA